MSGKKPVWVDESAHAILKEYASLMKSPMVEMASRLVLEKLSHLDVVSGQAQPGESAGAAGSGSVQKPVTVKTTAQNRRRKSRKTAPDLGSPDVRFVGGVWLV